MKLAKEYDTVLVTNGPCKNQKGKVVVVRERSVIVEFLGKTIEDDFFRTVVNHKNYKIL